MLEAGLYFDINARHLPKEEYDFLFSSAMATSMHDARTPRLFSGSTFSSESFKQSVTLTFYAEDEAEFELEVAKRYAEAGLDHTVSYQISRHLAQVSSYMAKAYNSSPMRPRLSPSTPDEFNYLCIRFTREDTLEMKEFPMYHW